MKGIVLAGGKGTRLYPLTRVISKQLFPVHDKPLVYYPISTLMQAKIKDILIISTSQDIPMYRELLGDGLELGVKFSYKIQDKPNGIAEAFKIGSEFIGNDNVCLILGDNIFHGIDFKNISKKISSIPAGGGVVFTYKVSDPERFGVVEMINGKPLSIVEKPKNPKSNNAVVGLYMYDKNIVKTAEQLTPSPRGELEITDINKILLSKNKLEVVELDQGAAWLDTGTYESLNDASQFIRTVDARQGIKIGCLEEISYKNGWISKKIIKKIANNLKNTSYGDYLINLIMK